ncbi:uncharacterized protein LOC134842894 [Symsagittifera roscoffensis]|uniref:uncharacterized protein LOC134842894 n=1 Tax=Symsagittifera roscoffensis TaxID=84072 RepID=UPI00307BC5CC
MTEAQAACKKYSDGYLAQPKGKNNLDTLMRDVLMKQNHGGFSTTEKGWVGLGRLHISIDTDDISKKNASLTGKEYFGAFTTLLEVPSNVYKEAKKDASDREDCLVVQFHKYSEKQRSGADKGGKLIDVPCTVGDDEEGYRAVCEQERSEKR